MRRLALLALLLLIGLAHAGEPADVALVLLSDVSLSIDDSEFRLEKQGYAAALEDKRVLEAIASRPTGAIAVAYVEFAGPTQVSTVLDWHLVGLRRTRRRSSRRSRRRPGPREGGPASVPGSTTRSRCSRRTP